MYAEALLFRQSTEQLKPPPQQNARVQLSNAKAAVDKPFPQEDELKTKLARLDELNILLNLDKRENEIVDGEPDEGEPKEKKREMER